MLQVDLNPGSIAGGSGGRYFVGDFDGTAFTLTGSSEDDTQWMDYGKDFYAAIDWANIPDEDGRHVCVGWMSNWQYGQNILTTHSAARRASRTRSRCALRQTARSSCNNR